MFCNFPEACQRVVLVPHPVRPIVSNLYSNICIFLYILTQITDKRTKCRTELSQCSNQSQNLTLFAKNRCRDSVLCFIFDCDWPRHGHKNWTESSNFPKLGHFLFVVRIEMNQLISFSANILNIYYTQISVMKNLIIILNIYRRTLCKVISSLYK